MQVNVQKRIYGDHKKNKISECKAMIIEKNNDTNIQIQYLGSNITSDGRCKTESEESRRASQADIYSAGQILWNKELTLKTRL